MSVSAVVVSHRHAAELERSLPSLAAAGRRARRGREPAGLGGSRYPEGVRVIENPRPLPLAANVNRGIAATPGHSSLLEPGRCRRRRCGRRTGRLHGARPRCGIAGPQMLWPDGTWQPSRRRFPTVSGTIVRRTPLRKLYPPYERQRDHYLLDERPNEPVQADWMLGAFLLQRRSMLEEIGGWDAGYRHYVEDIDLCYRAMRAGWERWYVPAARRHGTHTRR